MDVMCNDFWKSLKKKSTKKNIIKTAIASGCIYVLFFYEFTFEILNSSSRSIYESLLPVDSNNVIYINNIEPEPTNQTTSPTHKNMINNNLQQAETIKNSSFLTYDESPMWMEKKMTNYFNYIVPLSGTSNKTKRILGWNKDFSGGLR